MNGISFLWLEITGKCQLQCLHCYAESGPSGTDGDMTAADWLSTIDQAADLGVEMVQFIGGEPTLHRSLPVFVNHALGRGMQVEVFSNLVRVAPHLWEVFAQPGVQLATSYYSDTPEEHERITKGRGSHLRTRNNIGEALNRSIQLRVGVIDLGDGQRVDQARGELAALGVTGEVRVDHLRQVGRGVRTLAPDVSQLCGHCGRGKAAVGPDGSVWPCVFSRWMPVGNVRRTPLADVLGGRGMADASTELDSQFSPRPCDPACGPSCSPACNPSCWPTGAGPCRPKGGCQPNYD
ncbi:radical SAM protein [Actinosynnema pretiosum subsp. pretiosum]|uniref:Radical SAM protein n=1 Tax=Actinosynnema pretiosum subsp. pretiosum TaxID=103721 RepID=A0AA45LDQ2_9PSEU|nr:radical SAM protein [Actinosynnema pretiosum subsp. pretiosum]